MGESVTTLKGNVVYTPTLEDQRAMEQIAGMSKIVHIPTGTSVQVIGVVHSGKTVVCITPHNKKVVTYNITELGAPSEEVESFWKKDRPTSARRVG